MSYESIKDLLETVRYYHTVNIEQSFHRGDQAYISVKCLKNTRTLELTYIDSKAIVLYESIEDAALAIYEAINTPETSQTS
ncbi:hypothetical protein AC739_05670 [Planococcus glaciei]|uniref:Uncharacterized protein n=1 Tax=Planococcus glaciei TaxID=459472 RepID=A0A1G7ZXB9_9BACL|nr:hypothetical protein [Planococcus glaciei]ETP70030.1 hypothetical protein G159_04010 [Planococcus glaciei CHR43]KOF11328.1 hypothetical protein AC739_05670 [Planococcus glaciei]MBX0313978.1 hypothetical protein [Planococcus glaciei]QDY46667.1 hypothetical protein FK545_18925 [Planococcus glaciei]QKX52339.1 hypothetical protein HF394_18150 [Planococcus glaciei]